MGCQRLGPPSFILTTKTAIKKTGHTLRVNISPCGALALMPIFQTASLCEALPQHDFFTPSALFHHGMQAGLSSPSLEDGVDSPC